MSDKVTDTLNQLPIPAFLSGDVVWMVQIAVVLLLTLVVSFLLQCLLKRIAKAGVTSSTRVAILAAALTPLRLFVWIGGIGMMLDIINAQFHFAIIDTLLHFRPAIHILIICWFFLRLTNQIPTILLSREAPPRISTIDLMVKITTITIIAIGLLLILPTFGISISGILAFGGIGGIIIGLAAKDMLSNFFGAMMIHLDRPFAVGDWVSLPEKTIEGTVEHIGWRQVIIRTFDKRQLFVPNAMFSSMILVNPSRMTHRRILETIGVRYDDVEKLPEILKDIKSYLESNPLLDKDTGFVVNMSAFSAYSVNFIVSAYTKKTAWADFMPVKEEVLLEINRIIMRHGASIAFPTQVMYIKPSGNEQSDNTLKIAE